MFNSNKRDKILRNKLHKDNKNSMKKTLKSLLKSMYHTCARTHIRTHTHSNKWETYQFLDREIIP